MVLRTTRRGVILGCSAGSASQLADVATGLPQLRASSLTGFATVVSSGVVEVATPKSSNPTTAMSSGTRLLCWARTRKVPTAIKSEAQKNGVSVGETLEYFLGGGRRLQSKARGDNSVGVEAGIAQGGLPATVGQCRASPADQQWWRSCDNRAP